MGIVVSLLMIAAGAPSCASQSPLKATASTSAPSE